MKQIAGILIVNVVCSGVASAQELTREDKVPGCPRPESLFTPAEWGTLSAEDQQKWCAPTAQAYVMPTVPASRMRSPKLALLGGLTLVGGLLVALPVGQHYRLLEDDYCVTEYAVDYGDCTKSRTTVWTGVGIAGAGALLLAVGLQRVQVSASVVGPRKGAFATVSW